MPLMTPTLEAHGRNAANQLRLRTWTVCDDAGRVFTTIDPLQPGYKPMAEHGLRYPVWRPKPVRRKS